VDPSLIRWGSLLGPSTTETTDLRLALGARGDDLAVDLSRWMSDDQLSDAQVSCGRIRNAIRTAEATGVDWRRRYDQAFPAWMVAEARRSLAPLLPRAARDPELESIQRLFARAEWGGLIVCMDDQAAFEFRRRLDDSLLGGRLHPLIEVLPGETGRLATRPGSFPVMSWTRGAPRRCLVSSFRNGRVVSFDFNAMDARSLLSLAEETRDWLGPHASGDVYAAIAQQSFAIHPDELTPAMRGLVKDSFLRLAYGSASEPLAAELGISVEQAEGLRSGFEPIFARLPARGTRLALLGQAASSEAFRAALVAAEELIRAERLSSFALFPVHDELLMDFSPDELAWTSELARAMSAAATAARDLFPYRVKVKSGQSYGELEETR
jgi:hypothetical protein